jgi:hypothetical protein
VSELGTNEREVKIEEFKHWASLDVTTEFRRRLMNLFDYHASILSGTSAEVLTGRAQVLEFVLNPHRLFEE